MTLIYIGFIIITGRLKTVIKDSYLRRLRYDMQCKRFSEMYETVYRDLYHYALCLMKNPQEAEDAVSEAVVAAYENIHKLKKKKHSAAGYLQF